MVGCFDGIMRNLLPIYSESNAHVSVRVFYHMVEINIEANVLPTIRRRAERHFRRDWRHITDANLRSVQNAWLGAMVSNPYKKNVHISWPRMGVLVVNGSECDIIDVWVNRKRFDPDVPLIRQMRRKRTKIYAERRSGTEYPATLGVLHAAQAIIEQDLDSRTIDFVIEHREKYARLTNVVIDAIRHNRAGNKVKMTAYDYFDLYEESPHVCLRTIFGDEIPIVSRQYAKKRNASGKILFNHLPEKIQAIFLRKIKNYIR